MDEPLRREDLLSLLEVWPWLSAEAHEAYREAVCVMDGDGLVPSAWALLHSAELPALQDEGLMRVFGSPERVQITHWHLFRDEALRAGERVYFVRDAGGGAVKIGRSRRIYSRLAALQTANPDLLRIVATVEGGPRMEAILHNRFALYRRHGEWFDARGELLALVEELGGRR